MSNTLDIAGNVKLTFHICTTTCASCELRGRCDREDLAEVLRVSRQTVNAIETGRYLPSLPLAIALARFFGKPVEELFHGDDDEQ